MLGKFGSFDTVGSRDFDVIRGWWDKDPAANIGVVTGSRSGFIVLDVDRKRADGGASLLLWMEETGIDLPDTVFVLTPSGGRHIWYKLPESHERVPKKIGWLPGVDFCGDGCQVAMPPSVREVVISDPKIEAPSWSQWREYELGSTPGLEPALAPAALLEDVKERPPTIISGTTGEIRQVKSDLPRLEWFKEYGLGHHTGSRNTDCLLLARRLFRVYGTTQNLRGSSLCDMVLREVRTCYDATTCLVAFPWSEATKTVAQAEKYWNTRVDETKRLLVRRVR
jgi:hypothetical protein